MSRLFRVVLGLAAVVLPGAAPASAQPPCPAPTAANPVVVCFESKPLTVEHCERPVTLAPHFTVRRYPEEAPPPYYFTYQLTLIGAEPDEPVNPLNSKYLVTRDDPNKQVPYPHPAYHGPGQYTLKVTAYARASEGESIKTGQATSAPIELQDLPRVRAVVLGVGKYAKNNGALADLRHADSDARFVGAVLKDVLPPGASIAIRTSDDPAARLMHWEIVEDLIDEERRELCGENDWFIFYYSGHGIVGANRRNNGPSEVYGHFLGTRDFTATRLRHTALGIKELLDKVAETRATNQLVILDSCFSGSSQKSTAPPPESRVIVRNAAPSPPPQPRRHASKVAFVVNDELLAEPLSVGTPENGQTDSDTLSFKNVAEGLDADRRRHALYLSAANSTHPAEEGHITIRNGEIYFEPESDSPEEDSANGYGLYTYMLFRNIVAQLPKGVTVAKVLSGTKTGVRPGPCAIDLESANMESILAIKRLAEQVPEEAGRTSVRVPGMACQVTVTRGLSDVPAQ